MYNNKNYDSNVITPHLLFNSLHRSKPNISVQTKTISISHLLTTTILNPQLQALSFQKEPKQPNSLGNYNSKTLAWQLLVMISLTTLTTTMMRERGTTLEERTLQTKHSKFPNSMMELLLIVSQVIRKAEVTARARADINITIIIISIITTPHKHSLKGFSRMEMQEIQSLICTKMK